MTHTIASKGLAALACALLAASGAQADTGPCATDTGGPLPDLIVDRTAMIQYLSVSEEKFAKASCTVQEGFVSGPGVHSLLRFRASTPNIGPGALVIGNPAACGNLFEQSSCHGHLHFREYADYRLWTPEGYDIWLSRRDLNSATHVGVNAVVLAESVKNKSLINGRKMGFCMIDSANHLAPGTGTPVYTACTQNQGLSPGWTDIYDANLDGQYVEADTLKPGDYVLELHVNPERLLPETNYTNNTAAIRVRFTPRRGSQPATIEALN